MKKAALTLLLVTVFLTSWAADESGKLFDPVSPTDTKAAAAFVEQGKAFYSQGQIDAAINAFTKALACDRTNQDAHEWLSKTAAKKGLNTPSPTPAPPKAKQSPSTPAPK